MIDNNNSTPIITVNNLHKSFGKLDVLQGKSPKMRLTKDFMRAKIFKKHTVRRKKYVFCKL